jgi:hypothetical protein
MPTARHACMCTHDVPTRRSTADGEVGNNLESCQCNPAAYPWLAVTSQGNQDYTVRTVDRSNPQHGLGIANCGETPTPSRMENFNT